MIAQKGSAAARFICGLDDEAGYKPRFFKIQQLSSHLSSTDVALYLAFLAQDPKESKLDESALATLKNDVADKLLEQQELPAGLPEYFIQLIGDPVQGDIWREYVLQKLPELYLRLTNGAQQEAVLTHLWQQSENPDYLFAGTALVGLQRLSEARPDAVDIERLGEAALKVARTDEFQESVRASALSLAAKYHPTEALEAARALLEEESSVVPRMVAMHVIGQVGDVGDISLLERYRKSPDIRLRTAARAAIQALKE